jgi:hypothetical protein
MSFWVRKNQRNVIRRAYALPCRVVRETDFKLIGSCAVDVSQDGMMVLSDYDLWRGEDVFVSFQATELGIWFHAQAKVARVIEGRRPGDPGRALGLRFTKIDPIKRFILGSHLRRVPPPIPKRPQRIDWAASMRKLASSILEADRA